MRVKGLDFQLLELQSLSINDIDLVTTFVSIWADKQHKLLPKGDPDLDAPNPDTKHEPVHCLPEYDFFHFKERK